MEQQAEKKIFSDGEYHVSEIADSINNDFSSEKELCDYIEKHIHLFCKDCLGVVYKSHTREHYLMKGLTRRRPGSRRLDFMITTDTGERIGVECKHPKQSCDLPYSIGQALSYLALSELFEQPIHRFIILSTKIDSTLPLIISKYNLPIGFIAFDKDKFLTYLRQDVELSKERTALTSNIFRNGSN